MALLQIAGLVGMGLMLRARQDVKAASWVYQHQALRFLAESAAEELFVALVDGANNASSETYLTWRSPAPGTPQALRALVPVRLQAELEAQGKRLGGRIELVEPAGGAAYVLLTAWNPISPDVREGRGTVEVGVSLRFSGPAVSFVEGVRVVRKFQVCRTTLPVPPGDAPLESRVALHIARSEQSLLPARGKKKVHDKGLVLPAQGHADSRAGDAYMSLEAALTGRYPRALGLAPRYAETTLAYVERLSSPRAMAVRAQFLTTGAEELASCVRSRLAAGVRLAGIYHNLSDEICQLDLAGLKLRGRCVISSDGPIEVGDVELADPLADSLMIVSAKGITVTGRTVQASLVSLGSGTAGVTFSKTARVLGPVLTARFPRGTSMLPAQLAACEIGERAGIPALLEREELNYEVVIAPDAALEHRRD